MIRWIPSIELIEIIYEKQIGIPVQYDNMQHLESALDMCKWGIPYKEKQLSVYEGAAILMRNITQFHVFVDGCKRMGILISYIFLRKNGFLLEPQDPEEIFLFPMAVARGKLSLKEIQSWFELHCKKI
ncbi:MAG: type II toxin-antitoxin system death-on-curing family toxin [Candidatus Lokiarchaeota archaeon]|nr:type II toxin-antitoxin system death-on-curing family toxin [Candidatus Harpocratesius repetitus]